MGIIGWLKNPDGSPGISKNYVFGCKRRCLYCYGKLIAKRFGMAERMSECEMKYEFGKNWDYNNIFALTKYAMLVNAFKNFIPTFRPSVLAQKLPRKPTMIFFSMSDPAYWKDEWYEKILEKICNHMQHTFVILTKSPRIYEKYTFPHNTWLGTTITNNDEWRRAAILTELNLLNTTFISFEPLHEMIDEQIIDNIITGNWSHYKDDDGEICYHYGKPIDWVIVGPETGNRKNRIIAKPDMIEPFYDLKTLVFMKEACKQVIGKKLRQEWPEGYMKKQDEYGRKECSKERPYDYKGGQWYHPYAKITDANYDYMSEYYCPICDLTFTITIGD